MEPEPNQEAAEQNKEKERLPIVAPQTPVGEKLEAEKPKPDAQEPPKPKRPYFWTSIFRWVRRDSTATDWIIAIFTIVIASVGYFQYTEMDDSGRQTDKMLHFVRSQLKEQHIAAAAAQTAATAASTQATNTQTLAERALTQAQATNRMAREAKRAADIAQAGLEAQDRAWIGYDHISNPENVAIGSKAKNSLFYRNWGKGPALHVTHQYKMNILCGEFPKHPDYGIPERENSIAVMPNQFTETGDQAFATPLTEHDLATIKTPGCGLYVYARILYTDSTNRAHWRHFCGKWNVATDKTFESCTVYNDGDEDYPDGKEP